MPPTDPPTTDATGLPAPTIRPAAAEDVPRFAPVFRHADGAWLHLADGTPEARAVDAEVADDLVMLGAGPPEAVLVAEAGGAPVGFGAAAIRGRHWHLAYLFVEPAWQGRGVGGRLLRALHAAGRAAGCDVFTTEPSADARGLSAYLALGMLPRPPAIRFAAVDPAFSGSRLDDPFEAVPIAPGDANVIETVGDVDAAVRGARRPDDLRRWLAGGATAMLLLRREPAIPAGYAVLRPEGAGRWRIGPVAAMDVERVPDVFARALAAAASLHRAGHRWRLELPGENHALVPPLLAAGFRPERVLPLLASGPIGRWDRYVFADLDVV